MDVTLFTLKSSGMHILNYLDDWLILAHSENLLNCHKSKLLHHLQCLGLSVNVQMCMLQRSHIISFLGREMDSMSMRAHLSQRLPYAMTDQLLASGQRLHPQGVETAFQDSIPVLASQDRTVAMIWDIFGKAEVDLFASEESTHCPLCFSLTQMC